MDLNAALCHLIRRGEQSAITLETLGSKVTLIVDCRDQKVERGESGTIRISLINSKDGPDFGSSFHDVKFVRSLQERDLNSSDPMHDVGSD
jgi:hypothetical protein